MSFTHRHLLQDFFWQVISGSACIRDKQYERVIKIEKGKVTNKVCKINKSHMAAMNSKHMKLCHVLMVGWLNLDQKNISLIIQKMMKTISVS
jgi:hypothetical protein